jgi:hypothetical protein
MANNARWPCKIYGDEQRDKLSMDRVPDKNFTLIRAQANYKEIRTEIVKKSDCASADAGSSFDGMTMYPSLPARNRGASDDVFLARTMNAT